MKKMIFICCLLVLFFAVLGLKTVVDQGKISMNDERILSQSTASDQDIENVNSAREAAAQDQSTSENTNDSYLVNLEVDGGYLSLRIPNGYHLQEYQLSDLEKYPDNYVFFNEAAQAKFIVYSKLDDEKNQSIGLGKLYDKSNKFIIFDDVLIGEYSYIVHTKEQATFDYGFHVREGNGYSYYFQHIVPYDTIQNGIPMEAISILSTLQIQAAIPGDTDIPDGEIG